MCVVNRLLCLVAILGAAIFFASDALAQCSTVNPTCDFACSVLKYCPGPIACNVDTDCGVGGARCITGICRGGRPTGGCHLLVEQINVALARLGILNASIQRSVSAQICRGRALAQVEAEVAARAQGLRQLAVVMDRPSSAVCAKRTPTAATISVVRGTFVNRVDQGVGLEVPRAQ
jgi:hypothetical protein